MAVVFADFSTLIFCLFYSTRENKLENRKFSFFNLLIGKKNETLKDFASGRGEKSAGTNLSPHFPFILSGAKISILLFLHFLHFPFPHKEEKKERKQNKKEEKRGEK